MQLNRKLLGLVAVAPAFGFTNCEHFSNTTVPASDSNPPLVGTRYLDNDGGDAIRFSGFTETINGDPDKNYFVVPFGFDSGGVQSITVNRGATSYCDLGGGIGSITHFHFFTESDQSSAGVGDVVSNGRYLYFAFNPRQFTPDGDCEVSMGWTITATDYNGNTQSGGGGIIYYP